MQTADNAILENECLLESKVAYSSPYLKSSLPIQASRGHRVGTLNRFIALIWFSDMAHKEVGDITVI